MKRLLIIATLLLTLWAFGAISVNAAGNSFNINFEDSSKGIVKVLFNTGTDKKVKLLIQKDADRYVYNLDNQIGAVNFPLQHGDGYYTVSIYENVYGSSYRRLTAAGAYVTLENPNIVFLQSVQEIDWNLERVAIAKANQLVAAALEAKRLKSGDAQSVLTEQETLKAIYDFVTANVVYNYTKIHGLPYNYLPNIDSTIVTLDGICYDYSSLLASMLRSQGIPTKLVKGYTTTTNVYHAWNEIYSSVEKKWMIVDSTFDAYYLQHNRPFTFEKSAESYAASKYY